MSLDVELVMKRFDFEKVWRVMAVLGWKWTTPSDIAGGKVPSVKQLKATAKRLLTEMAKPHCKAGWSSRIGGFKVSRHQTEEGNAYLELEFVLEEAESEYPE